jgi:hypothetical protein
VIPVDLAPEVLASLHAMSDSGAAPQRCLRRRGRTGRRAARLGPDSVLAALGIVKPEGVQLEVESEDLGQGETETRHRYQWTDGDRSILAEQVKNEIFDGATPYTTYVRGVIIDGDRGVLLHGRDGGAQVIEG